MPLRPDGTNNDGLTDFGLGGPGLTTNFEVRYLQSPGNVANMQANANALLAVIANEFKVTTDWFGTPPGKFGATNRHRHVFAGGEGVLYAVMDNGELHWYQNTGWQNGTGTWVFDHPRRVGKGWSGKHFFSGGDGVIYIVQNNGDLLWHRHDGWAAITGPPSTATKSAMAGRSARYSPCERGNTQKAETVIVNGRLLDRKALGFQLAEAENNVRFK